MAKTESHHHHPATQNLATAFFLNLGFAAVELVGGLLTNSVAILSDALHDLGDSFSLAAAWYFNKKSSQKATQTFTYGYRRFSLLGAFITAIVLAIGSFFIIREALARLAHPEPAHYPGMIGLAVLGIAVNSIAMWRLKKGGSISEKVVSLHFLEDVLGWVAVLVGAVVMLLVDVPVLDPVLSLLIAVFVLVNIYRNLKPAVTIILQGVPAGLPEKEIRAKIAEDPRITEVHDFRLWTLDGQHHVVSLHVVVDQNFDLKTAEEIKEAIKKRLREVEVVHATIEVEYKPAHH